MENADRKDSKQQELAVEFMARERGRRKAGAALEAYRFDTLLERSGENMG